METLHIQINNDSHYYPIYIGTQIFHSLNDFIEDDYSSILIITDTHVEQLYLKELKEGLSSKNVFTKTIPAGERSKNIDTFNDIHSYLIEQGFDRHALIVALGGGMVGDIAGFVASTYMRGIDYIQIPTTILAHDSSVGGKVAINHEQGKNMIGNFYQPRMIVYDTKTFSSLPFREIRSGYAELIKEAFIQDEAFLKDLLSQSLAHLSYVDMTRHVKKGIEIKSSIVEKDEKETGERAYLNLGHTLGHALETNFSYHDLTHGEAVAVGLLFSLYVSERIFSITLPYQPLVAWLKQNGYPLRFQHIDTHTLLFLMKKDKKSVRQHVRMVLLREVGQPVVFPVDDDTLLSYLNGFFNELERKII